MMIVAWCLVLNGYSPLGIITCLLASIYLLFTIEYRNYFRLFVTYVLTFLSCYFIAKLTIIQMYDYFPFFLVVMSFNAALLNERLKKERLSALCPLFMIVFVSFIFFAGFAYILPSSYVYTFPKENIYGLLLLIFIPYAFEILITIVIKEYRMKKFIASHKTTNSSKLYN